MVNGMNGLAMKRLLNTESRFWPNSIESQKIFYDSLHNDRNKLVLSIVLKSNDKHIGVISLACINWVHRYADL